LDLETSIDAVMKREPRRAKPEQQTAEVLDVMEARAITVLPVVDADNLLVGMVHMHDVLGQGRVKFSRS
jgi:arabinose-5-phosphate isomerase